MKWNYLVAFLQAGLVLFAGFSPQRALAGEIHEAVKAGSSTQVQQLLSQDPHLIHSLDESQRTPLHWAVLRSNRQILTLLLQQSPNLEATDFGGFTPLVLAAMGNLPAVQLLRQAGANLQARTRTQETALHWAADRGQTDIVQYLVSQGVSPTIYDRVGSTPLGKAAKEGHVEIVTYLLDQGASITAGRIPPLVWATSRGQATVVKALMQRGAPVNQQAAIAGRSALHLAAIRGSTEITRTLIAAGATLNLRDRQRRTPLFYAQKHGHTEVAELLVRSGGVR